MPRGCSVCTCHVYPCYLRPDSSIMHNFSSLVIKLITQRQLLNMLWCLNNTKTIAQLKENTFNAFSLAVNDSSYCSYGGIGVVYQSLLVMTLGFSKLEQFVALK